MVTGTSDWQNAATVYRGQWTQFMAHLLHVHDEFCQICTATKSHRSLNKPVDDTLTEDQLTTTIDCLADHNYFEKQKRPKQHFTNNETQQPKQNTKIPSPAKPHKTIKMFKVPKKPLRILSNKGIPNKPTDSTSRPVENKVKRSIEQQIGEKTNQNVFSLSRSNVVDPRNKYSEEEIAQMLTETEIYILKNVDKSTIKKTEQKLHVRKEINKITNTASNSLKSKVPDSLDDYEEGLLPQTNQMRVDDTPLNIEDNKTDAVIDASGNDTEYTNSDRTLQSLVDDAILKLVDNSDELSDDTAHDFSDTENTDQTLHSLLDDATLKLEYKKVDAVIRESGNAVSETANTDQTVHSLIDESNMEFGDTLDHVIDVSRVHVDGAHEHNYVSKSSPALTVLNVNSLSEATCNAVNEIQNFEASSPVSISNDAKDISSVYSTNYQDNLVNSEHLAIQLPQDNAVIHMDQGTDDNIYTCIDITTEVVATTNVPVVSQIIHAHPNGTATMPKAKRKPGSYTCQYCHKTFQIKRRWRNHLYRCGKDPRYACSVCGKGTGSTGELQLHILTHTNHKQFLCEVCPRKFATRSSFNDHKRLHLGVKNIKCLHCGELFVTQFMLRAHTRKKHLSCTQNTQKIICEHCGSVFKSRSTLMSHYNTHEEIPKSDMCSICGKMFANSVALDLHVRNHGQRQRPMEAPQPGVCHICGVILVNTNVNRHIRKMHGAVLQIRN